MACISGEREVYGNGLLEQGEGWEMRMKNGGGLSLFEDDRETRENK